MNNSSRNYYIHIIGCLISRLTDNPLESTPTARLRHFYTVPANRATKRPWFKLLHFTHSKPPNRRTRASRPCASNASHLRVLFERMFRLRFRPLCRRRTCPLHGTMLLYNVLVRLCARVNWFFFLARLSLAQLENTRESSQVLYVCVPKRNRFDRFRRQSLVNHNDDVDNCKIYAKTLRFRFGMCVCVLALWRSFLNLFHCVWVCVCLWVSYKKYK